MTLDPLDAEGVRTQPWAVPRFVKSVAAIPVTVSPNDTPNVSVIAAAGDAGCELTVAVGGSTSMVIVDELGAGGPAIPDVDPNTEFVATVTTTVPEVAPADDSDSMYGPAPLPDIESIDHAALVPDSDTSEVSNPVTTSEKLIEYVSAETLDGLETEEVIVVTTGATISIVTYPVPLFVPTFVLTDVADATTNDPPPPPPP